MRGRTCTWKFAQVARDAKRQKLESKHNTDLEFPEAYNQTLFVQHD